MTVHWILLIVGMLAVAWGGSILFSKKAAALAYEYSLDKYWLSPRVTQHTIKYIDGAFTLGVGMTAIAIAFMG